MYVHIMYMYMYVYMYQLVHLLDQAGSTLAIATFDYARFGCTRSHFGVVAVCLLLASHSACAPFCCPLSWRWRSPPPPQGSTRLCKNLPLQSRVPWAITTGATGTAATTVSNARRVSLRLVAQTACRTQSTRRATCVFP